MQVRSLIVAKSELRNLSAGELQVPHTPGSNFNHRNLQKMIRTAKYVLMTTEEASLVREITEIAAVRISHYSVFSSITANPQFGMPLQGCPGTVPDSVDTAIPSLHCCKVLRFSIGPRLLR